MARKVKSPEAISRSFAEDMRKVYGQHLESVVLYGSAVRGDFVPDRSDINFLVVLDSTAILDLEDAFDHVARWTRRGVASPLFLTRRYIAGALDSFPVEFLDMKHSYRVIDGEDPLADLRIQRSAVRLQAERDARGNLLRLRQGYLLSRGKPRPLIALIMDSVPAMSVLFRALHWLLGGEWDETGTKSLDSVCRRFDLSAEVFNQLVEARRGKKMKSGELRELFDRYLEEVRKLVLGIDGLDRSIQEDSNG